MNILPPQHLAIERLLLSIAQKTSGTSQEIIWNSTGQFASSRATHTHIRANNLSVAGQHAQILVAGPVLIADGGGVLIGDDVGVSVVMT